MKKISIILLALSAFFLASSCEKALDKFPLNKLSEETYFGNAAQLQLYTNQFYSSILPSAPYDEQSDLMVGSDPSKLLLNGSFRTVPTSGGGWSWTALRDINTCLANIHRCEDAAAVKEYTALCKFFRAWFYFDKIMSFGDVPWIDHELGSNEPQLYARRDSREVVMGHMLEDLDDAIAGLPASYPQGTYRATKWAALALKARICLFEGTFRKYHQGDVTLWTLPTTARPYTDYLQLAADAANQLMTDSPHKLYKTGNPHRDYQTLFSQYNADAGEFVLSVDYDFANTICHDATGVALLAACGHNSPTKGFIEHYLKADGTRYAPGTDGTKNFAQEVAGRDPRLHQTVRTPDYKNDYTVVSTNRRKFCDMDVTLSGYSLNKFVMPSDNLAITNVRGYSYNDLPVIRLAEVYLIFAEAKAELGSLTQTDLDKSVNLLRDRAGMPHLSMDDANTDPDPYLTSAETGYPKVTAGGNQGVILEIRRERVVELALEGLRYQDLLRWAEGERITKCQRGMYFPGTGEYDWDNDGKADVCLYSGSKPSTSAPFVYKIGTDIFLTEGNKGCVKLLNSYTFSFNPGRDYLYPIPSNERVLNPQLLQNPGWPDGLNL